MNKQAIINSIQTERLQLDFFEKVKYFKVPILCFSASAMAITDGFQTFGSVDFGEVLPKNSVIFLVIGLIFYTLKMNWLRMIVVEKPIDDFSERLLDYAMKMNWVVELKNNQAIILKTIPIKGYHEYLDLYHNKNEGERIYVFMGQKKVYLKSIDNLDNFGFKIDKGENLNNEKNVCFVIKQTVNAQ